MNGYFAKLDDKDFFCAQVSKHFRRAPGEINSIMQCQNNLDLARIEYAYNEYQQNLAKFSVLLHSKNPDHYKRSGALLHALSQSQAVTGVVFDESQLEDLETGFMRISYGDAEHLLKFIDFYKDYHNEVLAFDFAYLCCVSYENKPRPYDIDYLLNMSRYLKANNANINVDTCFMIFKSLML